MTLSTRYLSALLTAAAAAGATASVLQTQIVLAKLAGFGAPITAAIRAWTTLQDLGTFAPVMLGISLVALLPAILAGHLAARAVPSAWRTAVFAATGFIGLWIVFWLMRSVIPMPAIPGTRQAPGHLLMALAGAVGGWVYAAITSPQRRAAHAQTRQHPWRHVWAAALLVIVPIAVFFAMAPPQNETPPAVDPDSYRITTVANGLNRPWSMAFLPDQRVLVTEMAGRLLAIDSTGASTQIALDNLPPLFHQGGVAGLMEVALDPQFEQNRWLYLTMGYGDLDANGTQLVRARLTGNRLEDVRILFSSTLKARAGNNGGRLAFLRDGTIVMSLGDGSTEREQAQNPANHLGTVIRVTRDGQVPTDNPFIQRSGYAPEIYSLGHRNPQGIALDPATGDLLLTEHGARGGDEINHIRAGGNYGWPVVTGGIDYPFARVTPFRDLKGYEAPLLEWTPSIAPAGLAVYGGALFPTWQGDLLVPALKERSVRRVLRDGRKIVGEQLFLAELNERMRDVKVAPDGSIYVLTDGLDAKLLRVTPASQNRD